MRQALQDRFIASARQEIRAERGVAQYQRLASLLRHRIAKGEYPLGALLPPITQLADDLGVAVVTVRQAYELLAGEGLIRSQRGVGTHVAALLDVQTAVGCDPLRSNRRPREDECDVVLFGQFWTGEALGFSNAGLRRHYEHDTVVVVGPAAHRGGAGADRLEGAVRVRDVDRGQCRAGCAVRSRRLVVVDRHARHEHAGVPLVIQKMGLAPT